MICRAESAGSAKVMGRFKLPHGVLRNIGWAATAVMLLATTGMFLTLKT